MYKQKNCNKIIIFLLLFATASIFAQSKSLYFSGTAGNQSGIASGFKNLVDSVYTQEVWIKPDAFTASWGEAHVIQFIGDYHSQLFLNIKNADTAWVYTQDGNASWENGTVVTLDKWTHIAYVRDGVDDSARIYVNGILSSTVVLDHDYPTKGDSNLVIGLYNGYESGESSYSGLMDEIRIWNKALSDEEIQANMGIELNGDEDGLVAYYNFNEQSGNVLKDKTSNTLDIQLKNMDATNWRTENSPASAPATNELVALWHFDEGSDTIATDASGNGKNGILKEGAVFSESGVSGSSISIAGSGHVLVPGGGSLDKINEKITIETWVKPSSLSKRNIVLAQWDGSAGQRAYVLYLETDGTVNFMLSPNGDGGGFKEMASTTSIDTTQWNQVVVTSDGDSMRIYINGKFDAVAVAPDGGIYVPTTPLYIGDWGWGNVADNTEQYNGLIDEMALYNYAISEDSIKAHYANLKPPVANELVALWHFDEGSDTIAVDASGNGKDGILKDGAVFADAGVSGSAIEIAGTGHILVPGGGSLDKINKKIAIETWIKPASLLSQRNIILAQWDGSAGQRAYVLYLETDGIIHFMLSPSGDGGGFKEIASTSSIDSTKWNQIVVTSDGDSMRIYINGESDAVSEAPSGGIYVPTKPLYIGDWGWGDVADNTEQYNGLIDEMALYNYAISVDTIKAHYENLNPVGVETITDVPNKFLLHQNYPNPFNPTTVISFALPKASDVQLSVFNILGEKVAQLVDGKMVAGNYNVNFNATNLASGIYIYKLKAGNFSTVKKMILMK